MLKSGIDESMVFCPEGIEDLDIRNAGGDLIEVVQVKSYDGLTLSHLSPSEPNSFLERVAEILAKPDPPPIKLVNFGPIGPEMDGAWNGDARHQARISEKLKEKGYSDSQIDGILASVELVELNEPEQRTAVMASIQNLLTGVDAESAFDLLNFWLYRVSEQRGEVKPSDLIERITGVGRFLAARHHYHQQWFTTILPLEDNAVHDEQIEDLRNEFYAGVSARYEHILAELDFLRDAKLEEIAQAFRKSRVVILRAASGQGKTALAYRYLHDYYPESWRFKIDLVENRQHALKIATALAGHANAVKAPMAIFIDVSPRDTEWPDLVRRLAQDRYFQILVAIREEDFKRANISGVEFRFAQIDLTFDESEARLIFQRAASSEQTRAHLDFEAAWDEFGGGGPLMEFIYLLTQTTTLRHRLEQQVNRIRHEVREKKLDPDELQLLRLVAVATSAEARVQTDRLIGALDLREPSLTLDLFEREYLIRISADRRFVYGLHPIRSHILCDLLLDPGTDPWLAAVAEVLPLIPETDWESFSLHAFLDKAGEYGPFLDVVRSLGPRTWTGVVAILRCLLWAGINEYVLANSTAIEAARDEFGQGWFFIVDLNFAGEEAPSIDDWWETLGKLIPTGRQARFAEIRASQSAKENALGLARDWPLNDNYNCSLMTIRNAHDGHR